MRVVLILMAGLLAAWPSVAQDALERRAFSTMAFGVGGAAQVIQSHFNEAWSAPGGVDVFISTPFYAGYTRLGVQYVPYSAETAVVPDFSTYFAYAGWENGLPVWRDVHFLGGLRIGVYQMDFGDVEGEQQYELEAAARATAGLRYDWARWAVYVQASYGTVFLSTPVYQGLISFGFSHSFPTPAWLQDVLL